MPLLPTDLLDDLLGDAPAWTVLWSREASEINQAVVYLLDPNPSASYRRYRVATDSSGFPVSVLTEGGWADVLRVTDEEASTPEEAAAIAHHILTSEATS